MKKNLEDWINDAKDQFNTAMDKVLEAHYEGKKKKVKLKWKINPTKTEEVDPHVHEDFGAETEDKPI